MLAGMKASIYDRFGAPDVLRVAHVDEPPKAAGSARVRVHAAALNPKDILLRKGKMRWIFGSRLPRTPGYDIAGVLLDDADELSAGTEVFAMIQSHRGGGCAEMASVPFDELTTKPTGLSMVEAASLPLAGLTALQALRDELALVEGQTVMLNGASGGVGTLAVQVAKALGAEVLAVCSGRNRELVLSLGADRVIDYTKEKLDTQRDLDAVFDIYGNFPWPRARRTLRVDGRFCTTVPRPGSVLRGQLRRLGWHRAALVVVESRRRDLEQLRNWVNDGKVRPVVDRVFELDEASEAHTYIETRRARGKVVLRMPADH